MQHRRGCRRCATVFDTRVCERALIRCCPHAADFSVAWLELTTTVCATNCMAWGVHSQWHTCPYHLHGNGMKHQHTQFASTHTQVEAELEALNKVHDQVEARSRRMADVFLTGGAPTAAAAAAAVMGYGGICNCAQAGSARLPPADLAAVVYPSAARSLGVPHYGFTSCTLPHCLMPH